MDTNEIQGKPNYRNEYSDFVWVCVGIILGLGIASMIFGILYQPEPVNYQLEDTADIKIADGSIMHISV